MSFSGSASPDAGLLQRFLLTARAALQSSRGNAAAIVAISGSALIGMAGLATEGARYYLALQDSQGAADVSAMAAASAYLFRGRAAALSAGAEVAGRNGFAAGEVTVNSPPVSGAMAGNPYAFEVNVRKQVPIILSRAFLGRNAVEARARAVSYLHGTTPVCILALTSTLTIQNSSSFQASGCAIGSNAPGASVNIPQSNSSVVARGVVSFGTCNGCNNTRWRFTDGYQDHAPPVANPYAALDSKPYAPVSGASCITTTGTLSTLQPTGLTKAYCPSTTGGNTSTVPVGNTSSVNLPPGTYVFQDISLSISGTSNVTCNGCTFIFQGNSPKNLSITGTSSVNMTAPATNSDDAAFDGVLFYRSAAGSMGNSSAPNLALQNVSSFNLAGAIYAPSSFVKIGNLSSTSTTNCLALVGGAVEISSLSSYRFDVSNCATYRTGVPATRVVRLVE